MLGGHVPRFVLIETKYICSEAYNVTTMAQKVDKTPTILSRLQSPLVLVLQLLNLCLIQMPVRLQCFKAPTMS
jgi:hypothetical protein